MNSEIRAGFMGEIYIVIRLDFVCKVLTKCSEE